MRRWEDFWESIPGQVHSVLVKVATCCSLQKNNITVTLEEIACMLLANLLDFFSWNIANVEDMPFVLVDHWNFVTDIKEMIILNKLYVYVTLILRDATDKNFMLVVLIWNFEPK